MVTTTTTKWKPCYSLDLSCLLCAVCKSVFTDCRDNNVNTLLNPPPWHGYDNHDQMEETDLYSKCLNAGKFYFVLPRHFGRDSSLIWDLYEWHSSCEDSPERRRSDKDCQQDIPIRKQVLYLNWTDTIPSAISLANFTLWDQDNSRDWKKNISLVNRHTSIVIWGRLYTCTKVLSTFVKTAKDLWNCYLAYTN